MDRYNSHFIVVWVTKVKASMKAPGNGILHIFHFLDGQILFTVDHQVAETALTEPPKEQVLLTRCSSCTGAAAICIL